MRNWLKVGEWNVFCMVCNRKIKSGIAKKRWDGLIVCPEDYEVRHPLDFIRTRQERITVPFTSDTAFNQFNGPTYPEYPFCTQEGASGESGFAVSGCMRPGLGFPNGLPVPQPEIPDEFVGAFLLYMTGDPIHLAGQGGNLVLMGNSPGITGNPILDTSGQTILDTNFLTINDR